MTWRERIVAARARGEFTAEDLRAWWSCQSCLVGEVQQRYWGPEYDAGRWMDLNGREGTGFQEGLELAIRRNDFDFVEDRLDAIEDRAQHLKREVV